MWGARSASASTTSWTPPATTSAAAATGVVVRAMINVAYEVEDAARAARPLGPRQRDWITRSITVAKAMQAVGDGAW